MALPRWLARINRRLINPGAIKRGTWPVLVHKGRKSGRTYRTPLEAIPVDDGFVFMVNYGDRSDWSRNVMAAGGAKLELDGKTVTVRNPELLKAEDAYGMFPPNAKKPPSFVGVKQCLRVSADDSQGSA